MGTKSPGNESSSERKVQGTGTKVPENERARELGTKVPGNEKSRERKFSIGIIRSWERKVLGTKSPGTHHNQSVTQGASNTLQQLQANHPAMLLLISCTAKDVQSCS